MMVVVRLMRRVGQCWWVGHDPWPPGSRDAFCDRCGKGLGTREIVPLPPARELG